MGFRSRGCVPALGTAPSSKLEEEDFDVVGPGKGITLVDPLLGMQLDGVSRAAFQNHSPRSWRIDLSGRRAASETAPIRSDSASPRTISSSAEAISSERSRTSPTKAIACQILSRKPSFCSRSIAMHYL